MEKFYSVRQVVHFAVALEQASQEFYRRLADSIQEPGVRAYVLNLVQEEMLHEQVLCNAIDIHTESLALTSVTQNEVAAYIQAAAIPEPFDYKSAVRLARDKENASRMLYSILAASTQNSILKDLFEVLERQEVTHYVYFAKEYMRIDLGEN